MINPMNGDPTTTTNAGRPTAPHSFSVVIPCYNAGKTLEACLRPFLDSGYPRENLELIVADDGSVDRTVEIARRLGATVVKTSGKTGPGGARNAGAAAARMDFLLFIDSDIVPSPETIWQFDRAIGRFPGFTVIQAIYAEGDYRNVFSRYQHSWFYYFYRLRENYQTLTMSSSCLIIPREEFLRAGTFNAGLRTNEDTEFGYRIGRKGKKILICTDIEVFHDRQFTLRSFVRRNFFVHNFMLVRLTYGIADISEANPEYSVPLKNLLIAAVIPLILLICIFLSWRIGISLLLLSLLYQGWINRKFMASIRRSFGSRVLPAIYLAMQVDNFVKVAGLVRGAFDYYIGGRGNSIKNFAEDTGVRFY